MGRVHSHIHLSEKEAKKLEEFIHRMASRLKERGYFKARRRAQAIWLSHQGYTVPQIYRRLNISESTVRRSFATYRREGIKGLQSPFQSY